MAAISCFSPNKVLATCLLTRHSSFRLPSKSFHRRFLRFLSGSWICLWFIPATIPTIPWLSLSSFRAPLSPHATWGFPPKGLLWATCTPGFQSGFTGRLDRGRFGLYGGWGSNILGLWTLSSWFPKPVLWSPVRLGLSLDCSSRTAPPVPAGFAIPRLKSVWNWRNPERPFLTLIPWSIVYSSQISFRLCHRRKSRLI